MKLLAHTVSYSSSSLSLSLPRQPKLARKSGFGGVASLWWREIQKYFCHVMEEGVVSAPSDPVSVGSPVELPAVLADYGMDVYTTPDSPAFHATFKYKSV